MEQNNQDKKQDFSQIDAQQQEYTCPLCLDLIVEPMTTQCKHSFCELCVDELFDRFDKMQCPLDRINQYKYDFKINEELKLKIQEKFPEQYQERYKSYQEQKFKRNNEKNIQLEYGNFHDQLIVAPGEIQNTHKATIYVKLHNEDTQKYIKKVTYTFKPPSLPGEVYEKEDNIQIVELNWPFQLVRMEWGTYNVQIKIQFNGKIYKDSDQYETNHYLSFGKNGDFKRQRLVVNANQIESIYENIDNTSNMEVENNN